MVINSNLTADFAADALNTNQQAMSLSLERLSSGSKLVSAADDPAAMAMSSLFTGQMARTSAAQSIVSNAVSFAQTQDGYLSNISNALTRMSELAIEAQDPTKTDSDRGLYQAEFSQLSAYVTSAAGKDFNGVSLFSGATMNVTIDSEGDSFAMPGVSLGSAAYTNATGSNISTIAAATTALSNVEVALNQLSVDRATVGASESRLSYTANELSVANQNLNAANSAISDVDVATESTNFAKENILVQASTAMLAQANQLPQNVLKLLQ